MVVPFSIENRCFNRISAHLSYYKIFVLQRYKIPQKYRIRNRMPTSYNNTIILNKNHILLHPYYHIIYAGKHSVSFVQKIPYYQGMTVVNTGISRPCLYIYLRNYYLKGTHGGLCERA